MESLSINDFDGAAKPFCAGQFLCEVIITFGLITFNLYGSQMDLGAAFNYVVCCYSSHRF